LIVLDTSVLSLVFRRRASVPEPAIVNTFRELVSRDESLVVPGIVYQELLTGVRSAEQHRRLSSALSGFPLILATRAHHVRAAEVARSCRAAGVASSTVDCLIAAQALGRGCRLFTLDSDFDRIAAVTPLTLFRA
jgi:predicted nucleic acid-binding protein